jgi:hypothetical protein
MRFSTRVVVASGGGRSGLPVTQAEAVYRCRGRPRTAHPLPPGAGARRGGAGFGRAPRALSLHGRAREPGAPCREAHALARGAAAAEHVDSLTRPPNMLPSMDLSLVKPDIDIYDELA